MTPGTIIKKIRIGHGLSQEELGEKVGVNKSTVSAWESDKRQARFSHIRKLMELAIAINIKLAFEDFIKGTNHESTQIGG